MNAAAEWVVDSYYVDPMNYRPSRVSKLIREELAKILEREIETPNALATIITVDVDKKCGHARVGLSVIPNEAKEGALLLFKGAEKKLQQELMKKIHMKPMPRIEFYLDHGPEHAARVEKLLLKEENKRKAR